MEKFIYFEKHSSCLAHGEFFVWSVKIPFAIYKREPAPESHEVTNQEPWLCRFETCRLGESTTA